MITITITITITIQKNTITIIIIIIIINNTFIYLSSVFSTTMRIGYSVNKELNIANET